MSFLSNEGVTTVKILKTTGGETFWGSHGEPSHGEPSTPHINFYVLKSLFFKNSFQVQEHKNVCLCKFSGILRMIKGFKSSISHILFYNNVTF